MSATILGQRTVMDLLQGVLGPQMSFQRVHVGQEKDCVDLATQHYQNVSGLPPALLAVVE